MKKRIVLIGPKFFGYSSAIANYLNEKTEMDAIFIDERGVNSFFNKSVYRLKVLKRIFKYVLTRRRREIYKQIKAFNPTDIIFISPEHFSSEDLEFAKRVKCRTVLYMWDSFSNKPSAKPYVEKFDRSLSFDFRDVQDYDMELLNLFAEAEFFNVENNKQEKKYGVCFVGTLHSNRIRYLIQINTICEKNNINKKIHGFYGNYFYFAKAKFSEIIRQCNIGTWNSLSKSDTAKIFKESAVVLDITHPKQRGLTSRTFEALAAGAIVLTNNQNAPKYMSRYSDRIRTFTEDSFEAELKDVLKISAQGSRELETGYLSLQRFCEELVS